jgi:hypothetical protein
MLQDRMGSKATMFAAQMPSSLALLSWLRFVTSCCHVETKAQWFFSIGLVCFATQLVGHVGSRSVLSFRLSALASIFTALAFVAFVFTSFSTTRPGRLELSL